MFFGVSIGFCLLYKYLVFPSTKKALPGPVPFMIFYSLLRINAGKTQKVTSSFICTG